MESLLLFLHIIAWVVGTGASILFVGRIIATLSYDKIDKLRDDMNGVVRTFPH